MPTLRTVHDHLGEPVTFQFPPKRIVSLVPSQTELLFTLGLNDQVVGVTRFCIHPPEALTACVCIGGTKDFDIARINQLEPDLIIGNKEENYWEGIDALRQRHPVWMSDINTLNDALLMIRDISDLTDKKVAGIRLVREISDQFIHLPKKEPARVLYFIWRKPWMVAGKNTFIDHMLSLNGWTNPVTLSRYPQMDAAMIRKARPDIILLSSEPYPFGERHRAELSEICPRAKCVLVNGEMFTWYGSRLALSCDYFKSLKV